MAAKEELKQAVRKCWTTKLGLERDPSSRLEDLISQETDMEFNCKLVLRT